MKKKDNIYDEKYKYLLRYFCNFKPNELCNKLSYNKFGLCDECYNNTDKISYTDDELLSHFLNHYDLITQNIRTLLNECEKTNGKINKTKVVIKIYSILFYNFLFLIKYPNFLITNIKKLDEFFIDDKDHFINYCKENKDDTIIINFMLEIYNYVKKNNYLIEKDMDNKSYEDFLDKFIEHMKTFYDKINKKFIDIIDVNNISNCILHIDI